VPPRRRWLPWAIGCVGILVLLQFDGLAVVLAFPGLRAQIAALWVRSSAPPPESPLPAGQTMPDHPLTIEERFDQPTNRWEQSLARVADGAYEVRVDIPNYDTYGLLLAEQPVHNFDMAVNVQQTAGDPTAEYGVRFRFPQGGIGLFRSEGSGRSSALVSPVSLDVVKQGAGALRQFPPGRAEMRREM
jgi:hypothetical protein